MRTKIATGTKELFIAVRSTAFRCTTKISLKFTTYNSRFPGSRVSPARRIYKDRLMQIIIVVIILRGFLGVRMSLRIYCGCIKTCVHDRSTIARYFNTVFPNSYSLVTFLQLNFSSNYKWLNNKCSLKHLLSAQSHALLSIIESSRNKYWRMLVGQHWLIVSC